MQIPSEFFEGLFVAELFGLSRREIRYLVDHAPQELKLKLLHLEVWAHVCLHDASQGADRQAAKGACDSPLICRTYMRSNWAQQ